METGEKANERRCLKIRHTRRTLPVSRKVAIETATVTGGLVALAVVDALPGVAALLAHVLTEDALAADHVIVGLALTLSPRVIRTHAVFCTRILRGARLAEGHPFLASSLCVVKVPKLALTQTTLLG